MAFSIKNDEADGLVRELAALTGESLTTAVVESLRERLGRERRRAGVDRGERITRAIAALRLLPVLDDRTAEEILDYDESGLPA